MRSGRLCAYWLFFWLLPNLGSAQDLVPLASSGGVTLYSFTAAEQSPLPWLRTTTIIAKTDDPMARISTFEGLSISGDVVQAWHPFLSSGNVFRPTIGPLFAPEWFPLDTHLFITEAVIAGGDFTLSESNDKSLGQIHPNFGPPLPCAACFVELGIGSMQMGPSDAFTVNTEYASNEIEFTQVVTTGSATISVGIFGSDDGSNHSFPGMYFENIPIVFVPEPPARPLLAVSGLTGLRVRRKRRSRNR